MRQERIALILGICMLFSTNVFAAPVFSPTNNMVRVEKETSAERGKLIVVAKDGSTAVNSDIYAIVEDNMHDGKINFEFEMPNYKKNSTILYADGEYDVYFVELGGALIKEQEPMTFVSIESKNSVKPSINSITSATELAAFLNDANKKYVLPYFGCNMDEYKLLEAINTNEYDIATLIYNDIGASSFATLEVSDFVSHFNTMLAICKINNSVLADIPNHLQTLNPSFEGKHYNQLTDTNLLSVINSYVYNNKSFSSTTDFNKKYAEANALYILNGKRFDEMTETLSIYEGTLSLTGTTEYQAYCNTANKVKANEKLVEIFRNNNTWSINSLKQALSLAATAGNQVIENSPSYGGGGGGGVGGITMRNTTNEEKSQEPTDDDNKENNNYFTDMEKAQWAEEAVYSLAENGVIDKAEKFRPNDEITREEFVKMLVMVSNRYDENAIVDFDDVSEKSWCYKYVASAYNTGIVNGISEKEFGLGRKLTRQDLAVLCRRTVTAELISIREEKTFEDTAEIADYAKSAVSELYRAGIINGMDGNKFEPLASSTRAQCAVMLYNTFLK